MRTINLVVNKTGFLFVFFYTLLSTTIAQKPKLILPVGHQDIISCIAASSSGSDFISGSWDRSLKLWSVDHTFEISTLNGHTDIVTSVVFSPDGKYVVSGSGEIDGRIIIWDLATEKPYKILAGNYNDVNFLAFSPDGQDIICGLYDGRLIFWRWKKLKEKRRIYQITSNKEHIFCGQLLKKNKNVVIGSENGDLIYFNLEKRKTVKTIKAHDDKIRCLAIDSAQKHMISCGNDKKIILWNIVEQKPVQTYSNLDDWVSSAVFLPGDSLFAAAAAWNGMIKIFSIHDTICRHKLIGHNSSVLSLAVNREKNLLISSGEDSLIKLWDINTKKCIKTYSRNSRTPLQIAFSPQSKSLYAVYGDLVLRKWNLSNLKFGGLFGKNVNYKSLAINSKCDHVFTGASNGELAYWNLETEKQLYTAMGDRLGINAITFFNNDSLVASAGWGQSVLVLNANNGQEKLTKRASFPVFSLAGSPTESLVWIGYLDERIDLLNMKKDKIQHFSPEGTSPLLMDQEIKQLYSGSQNGDILVIDSTGNETARISGHDENILSFCKASPSILISASADETIRFTDLEKKQIIKNIKVHDGNVQSICMLDSSRFASAGSDDIIKVLSFPDGNEIVSMIAIGQHDWVFVTPDNYYCSSKEALKNIAWKSGESIFSFDQFDLQYNRPDTVLQRLGFADQSLIDAYRLAYFKRLNKMKFTTDRFSSEFHVPTLNILNKNSFPVITNNRQLTLKIKASDNKYKLDRIRVNINNSPVFGMDGIDLFHLTTDSVLKEIPVELSKGENKIQISCLNEKGVESLKESVWITYQPKDSIIPNRYLIAISVSNYNDSRYNLKYAVKDGRDMAKLFFENKFIVDTLFDKNATIKNIFALKQKLLNTKVDDEVILYVSGHGLLDKNYDFYFASYDMNFKNPAEHGIMYDDLEGLLDGIPARKKLLLMDACHSGEVDKEEIETKNDTVTLADGKKGDIITYGYKGADINKDESGLGLQNSFELMQELFANLTRGSGAVVISAAAGTGYALESAKWNNGVFTFCIINGLIDMAADANKDKQVTVTELKDYISTEVEKLTKGAQKPTSRRESLEFDWRVWE